VFEESTQAMVDLVPPGASDVAVAVMSASGVSVNAGGAFGVPLVQLALWSTETLTPRKPIGVANT
jgi:hypothetical protein